LALQEKKDSSPMLTSIELSCKYQPMEHQQLIKMANQIASFFEAYPDKKEAIDGVANHIQKFWAPKMRNLLKEIIKEDKIADIDPLVKDASKLI